MSDNELSFHKMQQMKQQQQAPGAAEQSSLSAASAPSGPSGPRPPNPPHDAAVIQQVMSEDEDNIQLRHIISILQRHLVFLIFVAIIFPLSVALYDCVLNQPYVPEKFRFGAKRLYSATVKVQQLRGYQSSEMSMGGLPLRIESSENMNINLILKEDSVRKIYYDRLSEEAHLLKGEMKQALMEYIQARAGISLSAGEMEDQKFTITATGAKPDILPIVAQTTIPVLNYYSRYSRAESLRTLILRLKTAKGENDTRIEELWKELSVINQQIADTIALTALEKEIEAGTIELTYLKGKIDYNSVTRRFFIGIESDIRKIYLDNPLREQWARLDGERSKHLTHYKAAHPIIQRLDTDIESIISKLAATDGKTSLGKVPPIPKPEEIEALKRIEILYDNLQLKHISLKKLRASIKDLSIKTSEPGEKNKIHELENHRDAMKAELDDLRMRSLRLGSRATELSIASGHRQKEDEFRQTSLSVKSRQVSPQPKLDIPIALVVGLAIGCSIIFLREHLDQHLHSPSDVTYHLRLNFLGLIPLWNERQPVIMEPDKPDMQISEIYAHLCNSIRYGPLENPQKRLLIASAMQTEGKSTISANLAIRYAMEGSRVLLIDADMRRNRASGLMEPYHEASMDEGGLAGYLSGDMTFDDIAHSSLIPGLSIIVAGGRIKNPSRLLGGEKMLRLLDEAEERFDIVIVDCPAVLPVVDATIIAPHMRGVLMVASEDDVTISAARMALYRLRHVGAPIIGAVLNKARHKSGSYEYYGLHWYGY